MKVQSPRMGSKLAQDISGESLSAILRQQQQPDLGTHVEGIETCEVGQTYCCAVSSQCCHEAQLSVGKDIASSTLNITTQSVARVEGWSGAVAPCVRVVLYVVKKFQVFWFQSP